MNPMSDAFCRIRRALCVLTIWLTSPALNDDAALLILTPFTGDAAERTMQMKTPTSWRSSDMFVGL